MARTDPARRAKNDPSQMRRPAHIRAQKLFFFQIPYYRPIQCTWVGLFEKTTRDSLNINRCLI